MTDASSERGSSLAHALVLLYAAAIAYASLQPFGDWMTPLPDTPFWLTGAYSRKSTTFDIIANVLTYAPLGFFASLMWKRASPRHCVLIAVAAGAIVSFAMETLQWYMPPRYATVVDFACNTVGALIGGLLGAAYTRSPLRSMLRKWRPRAIVPGTMGDVGLALIALWLVAQLNPAIPPFALTFDPGTLAMAPGAPVDDLATMLIEAAQSASQLVGVGLFAALLVRNRSFAGGATLVLVGIALLLKGVSAMLLLKPAVFVTWLSPGILLGIALGTALLIVANFLPRPVQVAGCAIALLTSLLAPLLTPDVMFASPPLTLFNGRFGHLLSFNGLTRIVLVVWPVMAAAWLFALAGRPGWGNPETARLKS
ncbi:MAG TPA: VanZ family protein [Casimicrobiaceae bacterium]|nr:VanZ family protein [Casimicrobiaceae bacterium]